MFLFRGDDCIYSSQKKIKKINNNNKAKKALEYQLGNVGSVFTNMVLIS